MNTNATSLDLLHEIIAPPPVPWWPPAPGWYWVLSALAVALFLGLLWSFSRWQHNRYRREALAEWRRQQPLLADPKNRATALATLAELLKRAALSAFPREEVATLTGPAWLAFLDRTGGTKKFTSGLGALLEKAAYDPRAARAIDNQQIHELSTLVRHWLEGHHTEKTA